MISKRLKDVKMILLVMGGKGGVGKSVVSGTLAALLQRDGRAVGLLDADVYGPSSALLFGTRTRPSEEEAGLVPPSVGGVKLMSVDLFAPGEPVPLTGRGAREVVKEMLALTHWGTLDYLIIDMPPATADIMMLVTSLRKSRLAGLVVATPDKLSVAVARRVLQLLRSSRVPVAGVLGNMDRGFSKRGGEHGREVKELSEEFELRFLGILPYDPEVLSAAVRGDMRRMLRTRFAKALQKSAEAYLKS